MSGLLAAVRRSASVTVGASVAGPAAAVIVVLSISLTIAIDATKCG
jgi:hypothetical protein